MARKPSPQHVFRRRFEPRNRFKSRVLFAQEHKRRISGASLTTVGVYVLSLPSKRGENDSDATNNQGRPVGFREPAALPSALPLARACRSSPRTPQAPPLPPPSTLEPLPAANFNHNHIARTPWTSQTDGRILLLPQTSPDSDALLQTVGSGGRPLLWLVCTAATGRPRYVGPCYTQPVS